LRFQKNKKKQKKKKKSRAGFELETCSRRDFDSLVLLCQPCGEQDTATPPPRDLLDGALMAACKASIPGSIN